MLLYRPYDTPLIIPPEPCAAILPVKGLLHIGVMEDHLAAACQEWKPVPDFLNGMFVQMARIDKEDIYRGFRMIHVTKIPELACKFDIIFLNEHPVTIERNVFTVSNVDTDQFRLPQFGHAFQNKRGFAVSHPQFNNKSRLYIQALDEDGFQMIIDIRGFCRTFPHGTQYLCKNSFRNTY
jgi:hypothetical protein